jgi:ribose 5-phosphate isomerase RpiB
MSRAHTNILTLGGRIVAAELADAIVKIWLDTEFEGGRHQRRIEQIAALEVEAAPSVSSAGPRSDQPYRGRR